MFRWWVLLLNITIVSIILRFFNLSPFTIYPDSYQNLIVAQNLKIYGSVTGFLGTNGMFYPDFFMWTRPLFPLLIDAFSSFGLIPILAARTVAFSLGVLAIPIAYFFGKTVFKNNTAGLITASLLALSYNHAVWSGLLMTEAVGVFFMLLFLWRFFATVEKKPHLLSLQIILTGVFFALAVLSRYEYLIIAIPLVLYSFKKSPRPFRYLTTFFGAVCIALFIIGFWLFPIGSVVQVVFQQLSYLITKILIVIGLFLLCYIAYRFLSKRYSISSSIILPNVISILLGFIFIVFLLLFSTNSAQLLGLNVALFKIFFQHDILISFFAFIGILKMLEDKKKQTLSYFVLISVVLLSVIYYQINPDMERYMTHVIPFLLIPASFGIQNFYRTAFINQTQKMRKLFIGIILLFVFIQIAQTAQGLRNLNDPSWYRTSYQEKAAVLTRQHLLGKPLLITSLPEPYYYFTGDDTQSIADAYPFIYIPDSLNNQTVVIVEDMGMRDVFPNFTKVIDTKLQKYRVSTFWVHEQYHSTNQSAPENHPVVLYKIKLGVLRKVLK